LANLESEDAGLPGCFIAARRLGSALSKVDISLIYIIMTGTCGAQTGNRLTAVLLAISLLLLAVSSCFAIPAIDIAAGSDFVVAVLSNRRLRAWGNSADGRLNVPTGISADKVSAGDQHGMVLTTDGESFSSFRSRNLVI
jgi:hypothetical protein